MIVGLLGPAGSGKSLAAKYLAEKLDATEIALADPLKALVKDAFDLTHEQLYGTQEQKETIDPRYNLSPRQLLQKVGQAQRNVFGPDVWVNHLVSKLTFARGHYIVSDVRYINEAYKLLSAGAFIWKIIRDNRPTKTTSEHSSENEWDKAPYDQEINNNGTIEDFYSKLDIHIENYTKC